MILTSDKGILKYLPDAKFVTTKTIAQYDGNEDVNIVIASRALANFCVKVKLPNLQFIQLLSAGFEGVDIEGFRKIGVQVSNAGNVYGIGMSEFIVYAMLMAAKRYNRSIKKSSIRFQRGYNFITELSGKTVGIMGVGSIGLEVAKRLSGFDMSIIGYDLYSDKKPYFNKMYSTKEVNEFLPQCDYLIISIPLTDDTKGTINKSLFDLMKSNVTIVNVGRQGLFSKNDFISALKMNKQMTAVLDMFELIPNPITNPFRRLSNVKVLPGVSAISKEINQKRLNLVVENINRVNQKQSPKFLL